MLYRDAFCFVTRDEDNFNIICWEFVITITNNDNVSITQPKPSSNEPTAYTVSSVEELPSDAVDGSMAIVPSDSIKGKWLINTNIVPNFDILGLTPNSNTTVFLINYCDDWGVSLALYFYIDGNSIITFQTLNGDNIYTGENWQENFSPINIYTEISQIETYVDDIGYTNPDFTKEQFADFLNQIATRLSGGYSLYIRENGEWIYKSEIV